MPAKQNIRTPRIAIVAAEGNLSSVVVITLEFTVVTTYRSGRATTVGRGVAAGTTREMSLRAPTIDVLFRCAEIVRRSDARCAAARLAVVGLSRVRFCLRCDDSRQPLNWVWKCSALLLSPVQKAERTATDDTTTTTTTATTTTSSASTVAPSGAVNDADTAAVADPTLFDAMREFFSNGDAMGANAARRKKSK